MVARICVEGRHQAEIGTWLVEVVDTSYKMASVITDVLHAPVRLFPTNVARNSAVQVARMQEVDILFMVDDDACPPGGFFGEAVSFLVEHGGPAVLAAPYCSGPPHEEVQVFRWEAPSSVLERTWLLNRFPREEATRKQGIEKVANVGTHLIAYRMDAFAKINPPYFTYTFNDQQTAVTETEDTCCHRKMHFSGVPLYVHWDHWCGHVKSFQVPKPLAIRGADIYEGYMAQARAELLEEREQVEKEKRATEERAAWPKDKQRVEVSEPRGDGWRCYTIWEPPDLPPEAKLKTHADIKAAAEVRSSDSSAATVGFQFLQGTSA